MPTSNKKTEELLQEILKQTDELREKLLALVMFKMQIQPETIKEKKEIDLDKNIIREFIEQIDHFKTVNTEDRTTECYCELELSECTNKCFL
jgi:hypothetical protein